MSHDTSTPRPALRGIEPDKIFPHVAHGEVYCDRHGVQLGVFHDTLSACESMAAYYYRVYGCEADWAYEAVRAGEDPDQCEHAAERVELAVDDDDCARWACVHCITCEVRGLVNW